MEGTILLWIQNHLRNDLLTGILSRITRLGDSGWFWILLGLLLLAAAIRTRKHNTKNRNTDNPYMRPAITCLIAMFLCFLIGNVFLKNIIARTRPYDVIPELIVLARKPGDYSFPSGHTAFSFSCATALLFTVRGKYRWTTIVLMILAAVIGFSRIYLGVHYPTDVAGGVLLGCICAKIAEVLTRSSIKYEHKEKTG